MELKVVDIKSGKTAEKTAEIATYVSRILRTPGKKPTEKRVKKGINELYLRSIREGDVERSRLLLDAWGADINYQPKKRVGYKRSIKGEGALHMIPWMPNGPNKDKLLTMLFGHRKIDVNIMWRGSTPLDIAKTAKDRKTVEWYKQAGGKLGDELEIGRLLRKQAEELKWIKDHAGK